MTPPTPKQEPAIFPLEKILTVSAEEYFELVGLNPRDYSMQGVHTSGRIGYFEEEENFSLKKFAAKISALTQVVVAYRQYISACEDGGCFFYISGTALIRKNN